MHSNPMQLRRFALALAAALVWIAATVLSVTHPKQWQYFTWPGIALVIILTVSYGVLANNIYTRPWIYPSVNPKFDAVQLAHLIDTAERHLSQQDALTYARFLRQPERLVSRVSETVRTTSRSMTVMTSMQLTIPKSSDPRMVPLLPVAIDRSADSVEITAGSGEILSTLNYDQRIAAMGAVIRVIVSRTSGQIYTRYVQDLEKEFIHLLAAEAVNPALSLATLQTHILALQQYGSGGSTRNIKILRSAMYLIELMIYRRPVTAVLPTSTGASASDPVVLQVQQRFIAVHSLADNTSWGDRVRDRTRLLLGVRPTLLAVPLANASLTKAYHLEVIGPEGTYLARQSIQGVDTTIDSLAVKTRARHGQRYGHVRITGTNKQLQRGGVYIAHFYERVPGSIGTATLSALAASVLIWVTGFTQLGVAARTSSDLIAVLLAVPAVMGAWTGLDRSSSLFGGTLVSRVCSLVTVVLSLTSAAYFVLGPHDEPGPDLASAILDRPGAVMWLMLASLATLNFASAATSWTLRSIVQAHFIQEGVK